MNDDERLIARIRSGGICAAESPTLSAGMRPYICSLRHGHPGAHVAKIGDAVVDTWAVQ